MAQILLFNIGAEKRRKILVLALKLGAACREVPPEDFGKSLGEIAGRAGFAAPPEREEATPFTGEMLVLDGLSRAQLDALLSGLRRERAAVALKAVVTEQNLGWTPAALFGELEKEHAALHGGGQPVHEKN